jgi:hypothetical protein
MFLYPSGRILRENRKNMMRAYRLQYNPGLLLDARFPNGTRARGGYMKVQRCVCLDFAVFANGCGDVLQALLPSCETDSSMSLKSLLHWKTRPEGVV